MESVEYEADFEIQSRPRFLGNVPGAIDRVYVDDAGHDVSRHLKTSHSDIRENEQLVTGAVSELAINRGGYILIELGRIETDGRALSEKKFREVIVNQIAASGQLVLTDPGQHHTAAAGMAGEDQPVRAILDAELLRLESRDRLEIKLKDARSGLIVWEKRFYSSPPSSASSHAH